MSVAVHDEAEVVVVGAGPSGSTVAGVLAELGHDVLLVDKDRFPREKPCGDGIMHPGVVGAERMGLREMVESSFEIESTRIVIGHRRQTSTEHVKGPGRPRPRCITRERFDSALLSAARERGARFMSARVDDLSNGGPEQRLTAVAGGQAFELRGRLVIAADGATSRLRRVVSGKSEKPTAYAIRQYFKTEKSLDPVLQVDVPLEIDGRVLPGYGWIFPLDEYVANVGVGTYREAHGRVPSLRKMLAIYVDELQTKAARRFGALEPTGEPMGSPVGIRSQIEVAGTPGVVFVGDAAGTTHPLTGEGIAFAIRGGEALAEVIHARSKRIARVQAVHGADAEVWHSFPQLGIDTSVLVRASMLEVNKAPSEIESTRSISEPFLSTVKQFVHESAYETGARETPAWAALNGLDPALGSALERANRLLLNRLSDRTPFVTERIHTSIRSHLGPMYAAVVLATAGNGDGEPAADAAEGAVAGESVGVLPELLTMLVDHARSKRLQVNNAMAVLTGDFAATRALSAAAKLGPEATIALAQACQQGCQGGMRDAIGRFATDRTVESWFEAAAETSGAAMVLATQLGSIIAGRGSAGLRHFGVELGIAVRLAEEIVDFAIGDELRPGREGLSLSRGIYPLPVLYAIEVEPSLPRLLAQHTAEQGDATEIVGLVRESGALDRAVSECARRSATARSLIEADGEPGSVALAALAVVPTDYVVARVPDAAADAVEAC